jgi:pumilio RNA-binding family
MTCTPEEKEYTFREIMADFHELVSDVFANYVLQKLIEVATPAQQTEVYETVKNNVLTMTLQTYGCRIVQKCLESFDRPTQDLITSELHGNVARCIQDQNGNHVIQKCIEIMPERAGFIVDSFRGVVHDLATHAYGCRVIQRVLEFCSEEQQSQIFVELRENIEALVCDQYGNYVIQHVLCHGTATQRADIIALLTPNSFIYSTHKFASNVVEKMYEHSNADQREAMLQALMQPTSDGCSGLLNMMKDQYANYVIQKIIDLSSDDQKKRVVEHIRPHVPTLRKFTYGKHIIARLERSSLLPSSGNHSQPPSPPAPVRGNTNANPSQAMPMQGFPPTTGYYGQHYGMQQQPLQHPGMRY